MSEEPSIQASSGIIVAMEKLAEEWQDLTGGSAFFMLITGSGASVQLSTKNFTKKMIKVG